MIEGYRFGTMEVDGVAYRADLKIVRGKVVANWWRKEGHKVDVEDVLDILEASPKVLVIGRGQPGLMVPTERLRQSCSEKGIRLVEEPTEDAVKAYNELLRSGEDVAAAFHLTC